MKAAASSRLGSTDCPWASKSFRPRQRLARVQEVYAQGLYGRLEYQWMLEAIEEVGDARLGDPPAPASPGGGDHED